MNNYQDINFQILYIKDKIFTKLRKLAHKIEGEEKEILFH